MSAVIVTTCLEIVINLLVRMLPTDCRLIKSVDDLFVASAKMEVFLVASLDELLTPNLVL